MPPPKSPQMGLPQVWLGLQKHQPQKGHSGLGGTHPPRLGGTILNPLHPMPTNQQLEPCQLHILKNNNTKSRRRTSCHTPNRLLLPEDSICYF